MGINGTVVWLLHEDSSGEGQVVLECVSRGQARRCGWAMVNEKRREARESFVILYFFSWLFPSYFLFCFNVNRCESLSQLHEAIVVYW